MRSFRFHLVITISLWLIAVLTMAQYPKLWLVFLALGVISALILFIRVHKDDEFRRLTEDDFETDITPVRERLSWRERMHVDSIIAELEKQFPKRNHRDD